MKQVEHITISKTGRLFWQSHCEAICRAIGHDNKKTYYRTRLYREGKIRKFLHEIRLDQYGSLAENIVWEYWLKRKASGEKITIERSQILYRPSKQHWDFRILVYNDDLKFYDINVKSHSVSKKECKQALEENTVTHYQFFKAIDGNVMSLDGKDIQMVVSKLITPEEIIKKKWRVTNDRYYCPFTKPLLDTEFMDIVAEV